MVSLLIVFGYPLLSYFSDFGKMFKDIHIQYFFPISPVKSFYKGILCGLARLNELKRYAIGIGLTMEAVTSGYSVARKI
jgi:hypothetical protein